MAELGLPVIGRGRRNEGELRLIGEIAATGCLLRVLASPRRNVPDSRRIVEACMVKGSGRSDYFVFAMAARTLSYSPGDQLGNLVYTTFVASINDLRSMSRTIVTPLDSMSLIPAS